MGLGGNKALALWDDFRHAIIAYTIVAVIGNTEPPSPSRSRRNANSSGIISATDVTGSPS